MERLGDGNMRLVGILTVALGIFSMSTAAVAEYNYYFARGSHTFGLWNKFETCQNDIGSNCVAVIKCGTQFYGHKNTRGMVATMKSKGETVAVRENWGSFGVLGRC